MRILPNRRQTSGYVIYTLHTESSCYTDFFVGCGSRIRVAIRKVKVSHIGRTKLQGQTTLPQAKANSCSHHQHKNRHLVHHKKNGMRYMCLCLFRSLKCTRIRIHIQLFVSFALNNLMWIIWYKEVVANPSVTRDNPVSYEGRADNPICVQNARLSWYF